VRFNRELSELTDAELHKVKEACDRAVSDGLLVSRLGVRAALAVTEAVEKEQRRRRGSRSQASARGASKTKTR